MLLHVTLWLIYCVYFIIQANLILQTSPILKSLHWLKVNERIEYKLLSLSPTKFLQPLNLAIFTTLYLFNLLAVTAPHLLSFFLARQLSPWKSQIARSDVHHQHIVFGSNFQIHSVSLTSHQSCLSSPPHPLVNPSLSSSPLSSSTGHLLFHSRLKTYLFNKSFPPYTAFMTTGLDRAYHVHHFIFSFTF